MELPTLMGPEWDTLLGPIFEEPWMEKLGRRVEAVRQMGEGMLQPRMTEVFRAFKYVQPSQLKVLIIGQDPYPNGQADGFAFSTRQPLPPLTLRIVFDELERTGFGRRFNPNLEDWAKQGVMLLNTILTCTYRSTLSHKGWGWEKFIGRVLDQINLLDHPFVVMAWGLHAQDLVGKHILFNAQDEDKARLYLTSIHPVAQSYSEGSRMFVGCGHFASANHFLEAHGMDAIEWNDPKLQVRAATNEN